MYKIKQELILSIKNGNKNKLWAKIKKHNEKINKKTSIIKKSLKQRRDICPYINLDTNIKKKIQLSKEIANFAKVIGVIKYSRYNTDYEFPTKLVNFYMYNLCATQSSYIGRNLKFNNI